MKTVLIADDEPNVTALLADQIARAGYHAETCGDGKAALEFIEKNHPDLLILDIFMPRLSGAEVLISLRDHLETQNLPVIVLSGLGCGAKKGGSLDPYAPDYSLTKPWNANELLEDVRQLIGADASLESAR